MPHRTADWWNARRTNNRSLKGRDSQNRYVLLIRLLLSSVEIYIVINLEQTESYLQCPVLFDLVEADKGVFRTEYNLILR